MKLFELSDKNTPVISPEALLINEFKELWDSDKDKNKSNASKILAFVYFFADYNSIYNTYTKDEKQEQLIIDLDLPKDFCIDLDIANAIQKYIRLQETPSMGYLRSVRKAADELKNFFDKVDLSEVDSHGKPIYKPADLTKAISDSAKVIESIDKWEEKVKKEMSLEDEKIYGGGKRGVYED